MFIIIILDNILSQIHVYNRVLVEVASQCLSVMDTLSEGEMKTHIDYKNVV